MGPQQEVMQTVFDSLCRCFGSPPPNNSRRPSRYRSDSPENVPLDARHKKRSSRLELRDKQWDPLFEDKKQSSNNSPDLEYAQALAKAKLAANPSRHGSKRKRSPKSMRDDIFRTKSTATANPKSTNPIKQFLGNHQGVANALCFATPVREADDELDHSDTMTLNTAEDTITSTIYFENKYAHVVENRPPMPLFTQFKLDSKEDDELRKIIATDSHSSLKMISLLNQTERVQVVLDDSDDDEESEEEEDNMDLDSIPPAVKSVTNSSSESSSRHADDASRSTRLEI